MRECPRCLFTEDIATIGKDQCNYCDLHDQLESRANPADLAPIVDRIKRKGRNKQYDCLIGISGGLDSSVLLYWAVVNAGLRPLVVHFDNGWNAPQAEHNMKMLCERLSVSSIIYKLDRNEYDRLNRAFLSAGIPDCDIPNDIAMTKLMYDTADKWGIKYILNGHDFRTEGSTPAKWTYMDARYIRDVYRKFANEELRNYPLFTFWDQIKYALKGIEQVRPFHYGIDRVNVERQMKRLIDWQDYGGKHCENVYTEYIGAYVLPVKFGIDKSIVYLSAQVRSGTMSKDAAKIKMKLKPKFDLTKLNDRTSMPYMDNIRDRSEFDHYDFKKWRAVIWALAKLKVVPYTMFAKYCK
jgi:hypothetical protein